MNVHLSNNLLLWIYQYSRFRMNTQDDFTVTNKHEQNIADKVNECS
jgi:hypothetical protein